MDFSKIRYILSPMAGFTDAAFRLLCRRYGADYSVTEFISSEGVVRNGWKTNDMTFISDEERPAGIQIFGSNPKVMANAAHILEQKCDVIDINFGCPAPKITKNCGGAALLEKPELIKEILSEVVSTTKTPVTAKMRLGTTSKEKAIEIAKLIEKQNVKGISVHGRTLDQGYSGKADWQLIKLIKQALEIPVFGNGDVVKYSSAKKLFEETNCDGILVGRGALGNPFVFLQCKKEEDFEISSEMKKNAFLEYLRILEDLKVQKNITDIKIQAISFIKGIPSAAEIRGKLSKATTKEEIVEIFKKII